MVHGYYYGAQYEIHLTKEVDLYNDVLPICIDVRKMISLEKIDKHSNQYKLVIIPYKELDKRFEQKEHHRKYMESLDEISYNHRITRKTHPELFKYYDVNIYAKHIKHSDDILPYTEETFEKLENKLEELSSKYNEYDYWEKYSNQERTDFDTERNILMDVLKVQRIIRNKEYFEEIKEIERDLTNIELTNGEKELINRVLGHPKLAGAIDHYGIHLIREFY